MVTAEKETNTISDETKEERLQAVHNYGIRARADLYKNYDSRLAEVDNDQYDANKDNGIIRNYNRAISSITTAPQKKLSTSRTEKLEIVIPNKEIKKQHEMADDNEIINFSMTKAGKIMIVAYALLVITLIIVAIVNAAGIGSLLTSIGGLKEDVSGATQEVDNLNGELSGVSKPNIQDDANMVLPSGEQVPVEMPKYAKQPIPAPNTNWFDRFCDFVSGIFGG